ncbi:UNVERIFIED_CONTAM: hypothetical protein Sradi_4381000 [Sesamum radiatum]|uniref:RNase H type-1 domain-containing protein n=1 Tax=Sesamum radiatum TaxID=300843 RepID=A0AAW2NNM9_SESRA
MRMAHEAGARHLLAYSDSQLIVKQIEGTFEAKEESMIQYLRQIKDLKSSFAYFKVFQIPREENVKADYLSKLASALEGCTTRHITIQYLPEARALLAVQHVMARTDWRTPIIRWIEEGVHVLQEIHSGCCGTHAGTWTLANKALRAGYFWPTMKQDAKHLVSKCERCQKHSSLIHEPA